ncbi:MAG TPA: 2-succinyl-5-enolpyruvyl-6-hydroxy-3-cyclohexene-1-carboxylic-acid synthase [Ornithinimicrobium sp.]|uniref:2-succinyl-5-enolpyruvyl-6-hydroxy-3- cyclohexene-1-carboxylic-acid synthase n=1 Tax=Ornithinimicrobium sp. TaxID=1977084 RepID=UPI002B470902|nr:2-succinyl-5-enolpyruvyl-6-hydroxy-3-cyclohexene-1-carboxylic-acid synthase [Ornithinimicrobium sp.]HKJ12155.1 2-succinyl-5-enolpyruvyl-6-hydroxy-3-cyclohexene-1-carboxylic-acid synthase [Ornithinimicrobium sp.]
MHPSTALATVLVDESLRCGVRDVVLCPGSRSAPLAYAARAAERSGRVRLHVRVDERSAGFLALGLAKVSRRPAVLITTSGTAVANLHPAVLEAAHAQVPLVVMSADRPAELRGTGANQTTVQPGIFAAALRFEHDQPPAQGRAGEQASWRTTVCRAWAAAVGANGDPGPVHLNVAFREPLAPSVERGESGDEWPEALAGRGEGRPWVRVPKPTPTPTPTRMLSTDREPARTRTLMVLGDLPDPAMADSALRLAAAHDWPVIAEPFGARPADADVGTTVLPHGPLLLADAELMRRWPPQRIVTVGRPTLHREVTDLSRRSDVTHEQVTASRQWTDPTHLASRVRSWSEFIRDGHPQVEPGWAQAWQQAGRALASRLAGGPGSEVSSVAVAATVLNTMSDGDTLVLGSSNAPRDVSLADPGAGAGRIVVGNRGLAGIDGTVSTAAGVALASSGRVVALMGDLTFQHDANGLMIGPLEPRCDLTIVVSNDNGGGIFATLEYGRPELAEDYERLFATATHTRIGQLCAAHGVSYVAAGSLEELATALQPADAGLRVVEVHVDPAVDRRVRTAWRQRAVGGDASMP